MAAPGTQKAENMTDNVNSATADPQAEERKTKLASGLFLTGISAISLSAGFGYTLAQAKKQDPGYFTQGILKSKALPESGGALAVRALGIGTLYAFTGVGILSFVVWKLIGAKNMDEFSSRMRSVTPNPSKNKEQGRSDFKTIRELVNYIISEDEKEKGSKT